MGTLLLAGMIILYVAASSYARSAADRSFDQLLTGAALSVAETLSVAEGQVEVDLPYAALDMLSAAPDDRVFYRVLGPEGQLVTGAMDLPAPPSVSSSEDAAEPRFFDAGYSGERVRFTVLGRQIAQPGATGWLWVQIGQTRRARDRLSDQLVLNALAPIGAVTLIALGVVWFGIGGALRPLTRIGQDLAGRGPSDLQPIVAPMPSEVAPLVDSMNTFMARLHTNVEALQGFIAEAAHQMRTPLAALLAQAQVAAAGNDQDRKRGLAAVERNGARLSRLLNQLLSDATIAHRSDVAAFEDFDLLRVVRLALRESVPMANGMTVVLDTDLKSAPFRGDALMIGEAVKNLVNNAFVHGRAGTEGMDVALYEDGSDYVVAVSDRGPGIPADETDRVFERFGRGRASDGAPGAGLGMAIVRQAIESHGGRVALRDRSGGGLTVELRAPKGRA